MDWSYDAWPSGEPYHWPQDGRGTNPYDQMDFHVDLGCGKLKKGRIGIDHYPNPGVNIIADLDAANGSVNHLGLHKNGVRVMSIAQVAGEDAAWPPVGTEDWPTHKHVEYQTRAYGLPFGDSSIESMISHHCLEHVGEGFIPLMDEIYRVLKPDAIFRAITPLFPSRTAIEDPDHIRMFSAGTWEAFCGFPDNHWQESFATPYTKARFELVDQDITAMFDPGRRWTEIDAREIRVALKVRK